MHENDIATAILEASFRIHSDIGPGMLETVYESALEWELTQSGLLVERQHPIPVVYRDVKIQDGFRADLIVERKVIVEIKAREYVVDVHAKILLTYLRFANMRLGLLLNFNEPHFKDGIKRVVSGLA